MKSLLIRYEDRGVLSPRGAVGLLATARLTHLQDLAQAGTIGLVSVKGRAARRAGRSMNQGLPAHWAWLGYTPAEVPSWAAGPCYAASVNLSPDADEVAWGCDFVTQHDGRLIDPMAGGISTKESASLIEALNAALGSPTQRWVVGEGSHHLLLSRHREAFEASRPPQIEPPERLTGRRWQSDLPRGPLGAWMREVLEGSGPLLERHAVNRVRVDLGENPANLLWLWGPSAGGPIPSLKNRVGRSGAVIARDFALRGLAKLVGAAWVEAPARFDESSVRHFSRLVSDALAVHDIVYAVVSIGTTDVVQRQCIMERMDRSLMKPFADRLHQDGEFQCLVVIEDQPSGTTPFVAMGPGLARRSAASLRSRDARETGLLFEDGASVAEWFMGAGRSSPAEASMSPARTQARRSAKLAPT